MSASLEKQSPHSRASWWLPATAFVLTYAGLVGFVLVTSQQLPVRMAIHFDIAGTANGWATAVWHTRMMLGMPLMVLGFFSLISWLCWKFPSAVPMNVPDKAYWAVPERREQAALIMARSLLWLCSIMTLFFASMHWEVVQANRLHPAKLPATAMGPMLIGFFALMAVWMIHLITRFARK